MGKQIHPFLISLNDPASLTGLPEALVEQAAREERVPEISVGPPLLGYPDGLPNSIRKQRWGIVIPQGEVGATLLGKIESLRRHRHRQQRVKPRVYVAPPGLDATTAARWCAKHYDDGELSESERPRYLLLLGDFDLLSIELQQALGMRARTGRLAFQNLHDYEVYCQKVIRWEATRLEPRQPELLLISVRDRSPATEDGHLRLMAPCSNRFSQEVPKLATIRQLCPDPSLQNPLTKEDFLAAAGSPSPTVMFSMSHGASVRQTTKGAAEEQRHRQGSLCLPEKSYLEASDVATSRFLPGGLWFYFACFGAGTPTRSVYQFWLDRLAARGQYQRPAQALLDSLAPSPFVAALPQAALANPEGPLAIIGHVDILWSYSYSRVGGPNGSQIAPFVQTLISLCKGSRAGHALFSLLEKFKLVQHALVSLQDQIHEKESTSDIRELTHLWLQRHDLLGFILLGDPAARLPR